MSTKRAHRPLPAVATVLVTMLAAASGPPVVAGDFVPAVGEPRALPNTYLVVLDQEIQEPGSLAIHRPSPTSHASSLLVTAVG